MTIPQPHQYMRPETLFGSHQDEEFLMLLSQLSEESLNLLALVSSVPRPREVLEVSLGQTVVAVAMQDTPQCDSITKLNSRFEFH